MKIQNSTSNLSFNFMMLPFRFGDLCLDAF